MLFYYWNKRLINIRYKKKLSIFKEYLTAPSFFSFFLTYLDTDNMGVYLEFGLYRLGP